MYKNKPFIIAAKNNNFETIENITDIIDIYFVEINVCNNNETTPAFMEQCTENHYKYFKNLGLDMNLNFTPKSSFCLPLNQSYTIIENNECIFQEFRVKNCENKKNCISVLNFYEILYDVGINLYLKILDYNLNFMEYEHYKSVVSEDITLEFIFSIKKYYIITFQNNLLTSETGLIFTSIKNEKTLKYYKFENRNYESGTVEIGKFRFVISKKQKIINRNYKKILDVLGQIGGILNIFFFIGKIIVTQFEELHFFLTIINEIFKTDKDTNIIKNKEICTISKFTHIEKKNKIEEDVLYEEDQIKIKSRFGCRKKKRSKEKLHIVKKKNNLQINPLEYLKILLHIKSNDSKTENIKKAINFIKENIDINYLIKNSFQIQKLMIILFSKNQIRIFESIPKPNLFAYKKNYENLINNKDNINDRLYFLKENGLKII